LLDPNSAEPLRNAALRAMARSQSDRVAALLLAGWANASPSLRSEILDALLSRPNWTVALLDAMDRKTIKVGEVTPAARARLLAAGTPAVQSRAEGLLNRGTHVTRQKVLDEFKPALSLTGDATKGAELFAKSCTSCHSLGGQGHAVGPDLTTLTDRSPQALLIAILDPNAAVDGKFVNYLVRLRDGRTLSGIIADENAGALTVLQPNGIKDTVLRRDIETVRSTGLSLMPEGLETGLTPQDLANLIAYVRTATASGSK